MQVKIFNFLLILYVILKIITITCFSLYADTAQNVYRSTSNHFSIKIPNNWIIIPDEALRGSLEWARQQTSEAELVDFECAFQPKYLEEYFIGPRILIQIGKSQLSPEDLSQGALQKWVIDSTFEKLVEDVEGLTALKSNIPVYDNVKQILYFQNESITTFDDKPVEERGISALILTKNSFIGIHCYVEKSEWDEYLPIFSQTIDSFVLDEEYKYKESSEDSKLEDQYFDPDSKSMSIDKESYKTLVGHTTSLNRAFFRGIGLSIFFIFAGVLFYIVKKLIHKSKSAQKHKSPTIRK